MLLFMVAVRDSAVEAYMRPFFVQARGQAVRLFQDEVNRSAEDNPLHRHRSDFELHLIASFDDTTGDITPVVREVLLRGKDVQNDAP